MSSFNGFLYSITYLDFEFIGDYGPVDFYRDEKAYSPSLQLSGFIMIQGKQGLDVITFFLRDKNNMTDWKHRFLYRYVRMHNLVGDRIVPFLKTNA